MADSGKQTVKDIALLSKYARMRYFGIGLEALRQKRQHYEEARGMNNISKALDLIRKDVSAQTKAMKVKGAKGKNRAQDFLAGGSNRDHSGNVMSRTKQKTTTPIGTTKYVSQLAGRWERMQNRMKMAGGMLKQANKGSASVKNPVADGLKGMLKMMAGASIVGLIGKKLFDSSPMLQAMMKLFNTSVMLIFRPIGDFIGGFLRPLMLFFMKNIAIPFYKSAKGLGNIGEMYGKQALGFLLKPMETIHAAIVTGLSAVLPDSMLGGKGAVLAAKTYSGVADWQLGQMENSDNPLIAEAAKQLRVNTETYGWWAKGINNMYAGQTGSGMGMSTGITSQSTQEIGYIDQELEISKYRVGLSKEQRDLFDEMTSYAEEVVRDGEVTKEEFTQLAILANQAKVRGIDIQKAFYTIAENLHTVSETLAERFRKIGLTLRTETGGLTAEGRRYVQTSGALTGAAQGELAGIDPVDWYEAAQKNVTVTDPLTRAEKYYQYLISQGKSEADADRLTKKLYPNDYEAGGRYEGLSQQGIRGTEAAKTRVGVDTGTDEYRDNYAEDILAGKNPAERIKSNWTYQDPDYPEGRMIIWSDYKDGRLKQTKDYGTGGVINEEIFGVGRSGQRYRFGESGSEIITPMNKAGGVGTTININVGNISKEADFAKLKPLIQRWILEANSRRGIV